MPKPRDRFDLIDRGEKELKTDDEDLSPLFTSMDEGSENYAESSEQLVSQQRHVRRPRTRLGRLWQRIRPASPWQTLQTMACIAVFIIMGIFFVNVISMLFSPIGKAICTVLGFVMTFAVLIVDGFFRRSGPGS